MTLAHVVERGYGAGLPLQQQKPRPPSNELKRAFERWLSSLPSEDMLDELYNSYARAVEVIKKLSVVPSPYAAEALLSLYKDHPRVEYAGSFISACHNLGSERFYAHYGCDYVKLKTIGYALPRNKTLLVGKDSTINFVAAKATGTVVFLGETLSLGLDSSALIISNGNASNIPTDKKAVVLLGKESTYKEGFIQAMGVNLREKTYWYRSYVQEGLLSRKILSSSELEHYVEQLLAPFARDNPAYVQSEAAEQLKRETIETRLKQLMGLKRSL